jgi:predicted nucleic acid-binding protein
LAQNLVCIDTNILVYAEGINDIEREKAAKLCLSALDFDNICIPVQALGELYRILVRKGALTKVVAQNIVEQWRNVSRPLDTTATALMTAIELVGGHNFQIWDALILAVSAENSCVCLLSEDMQEGFAWRGVEVVNPLRAQGMVRLRELGLVK